MKVIGRLEVFVVNWFSCGKIALKLIPKIMHSKDIL